MKKRIFNEALFAKADGTINIYLYKCRQFFRWLQENGLNIEIPISDQVIAAFLVKNMEFAKSDNLITSSSAAIKWLHSLNNANPTQLTPL